MSAEPGQDVAEPDAATAPADKPKRKFVRRSALVRMAPDVAERQGRVSKLAWDAFGGRDAALAFLNTHHDGLGGRPIDLAIADAAGLAAVEAEIANAASAAPGSTSVSA